MFRYLYILLFIALAGTSCKKATESTSEVQSLGNFAGGEFEPNDCHGTNPVKASSDELRAKTKFRKSLRRALSAVPVTLQDAFFTNLNGKIELASNMNDKCKSTDHPTSCWQIADDSSVMIYIKSETSDPETVKNIQHSTVRAFGFMLADVMLKMQIEGDQANLVENQELDAMKADIAFKLLANMAQSNGKYKLSHFKDMLPESVLKAGLSTKERQKAWEKIVFKPATRQFSDEVFVETFDSYFCSSETRKELREDFNRKGISIAEAYDEIDQEIQKMLSANDDSGLAAAGAMSLWGGRIIRGAFRGVGRGVAAVGRGAWRAGRAVVRGGAAVVRGGARAVAAVGRGAVRWGQYRASGGGFMNPRKLGTGRFFGFGR
jgi:hypothetical protein